MTTPGRAMLLRHTSEANFAAWVVREAERAGWCGWSVRQSLAVVQGVHTQRRHGHSDAHGWPDWIFLKPGHRMLAVELKTSEGRLTLDQRRTHAVLSSIQDPPLVVVWRPTDEALVRETFRTAT